MTMAAEPTPFQKIIRQRRSIRRFLPDPVEKEKLLACLEAARIAPSAHNAQSWRFLVIDDPEIKERFAGNVFSGLYKMTKFAAQAPVLVLIMAELDVLANRLGRRVQGVPFYALDIGIAGEHFVLQAEELGLSTCWIGWFNMRKARRFFKIPRRYKILSLLALGYAASRPPRAGIRKPIGEIVRTNTFRD
jgi:nitroreductase